MSTFTRRQACTAIAAGIAAGISRAGLAQDPVRAQLLLLGTQGGPNYNWSRGETASLLLVDGTPYLVDCGYGTLRALIGSGTSYLSIGNIFLTHLHDDHTADLPALLSHQWTQGRVLPTTVYGPYGTEELVEAAVAYNKISAEIRLVDEARTLDPASVFSGVSAAAQASPLQVFDDGRVRASCVENTHYPDEAKSRMPHRALSWRFDCPGRSIVVSGDTTYSENLVNLAQGADLLVCEAMQIEVFRRSFDRMVANGNYADNPEGIWSHIAGTHTSTEDAGRMAQAAGVRTLVLNHLIPGGLEEIDEATYIAGARMHFAGEIIVGRDQLLL
jgi:ribonuclease BN (tRNA processing enzyme)